ncbi:hypothetical protein HYH02_006088 [Chlamydomonas schloesseri]|uniref:Uncharacterized protein n=1 Tax=Chlamydomonas schloesseri TaxID=2026947 RepID=A0A836B6I7_9CHLO|nr:hypothetical protein HYH02_006088 [Chlamydomonas schloesseri]|eukprot:KAG2448734.1 hypothetical protein HYH02_006088 [Chlamydomonas schloesseri]
MVSRTRAAEALGAATSDERGKLLFFLHKVSDEELSGWDIEGQDNDTILSFIREAYKHAQGGSLPAAAASAPGLGSAEGAGTASAANQGAVPLLGRGGDGGWFWLLFGHFAAVADRYPSPHRCTKRGGMQALQLMRQHQD